MKITWSVDDGYVGGDRPQPLKIDEEDLLQSCETIDQAVEYVEEAIQNDFEQSISWKYNGEKVRAELEKLLESRPKESP